MLADVRQVVWSMNPNLPLASVRTLHEIYDKSLARTSFTLVIQAIAGTMALLIGLVGIYPWMCSANQKLTDGSPTNSSSEIRLFEKSRLNRCIVSVAKVAQSNAD